MHVFLDVCHSLMHSSIPSCMSCSLRSCSIVSRILGCSERACHSSYMLSSPISDCSSSLLILLHSSKPYSGTMSTGGVSTCSPKMCSSCCEGTLVSTGYRAFTLSFNSLVSLLLRLSCRLTMLISMCVSGGSRGLALASGDSTRSLLWCVCSIGACVQLSMGDRDIICVFSLFSLNCVWLCSFSSTPTGGVSAVVLSVVCVEL